MLLKKVRGSILQKKSSQTKFLKTLKFCKKITYGGSDTFAYKIQKIQIPVRILISMSATLQLVPNIKPIR